MIELWRKSLEQHYAISCINNVLNIDKVHVIGRDIKKTYQKIKNNKKGLIFNRTNEINDLINKKLSNNDYLMIKGSNSTGLFEISKTLKKKGLNVL